MALRHLKGVRIALSLLFFVSTALLFLDLSRNLTQKVTGYLLYIQFVPSLLKFLTAPAFTATGFILAIILSLLLGRVYCSSACPLGTLQDLIIYLKRKILPKSKLDYRPPSKRLRYILMGLTIILFIAGSSSLLVLLDPYSNFGRLAGTLLRHLAYSANNSLAFILGKFDIYYFSKIDFKSWDWFGFIYALCFLAIIIIMSFSRGRLFCNTVCPVGTLLGIFSKFSIFVIKINKSSCTSCGLCERNCKAECIDSGAITVDMSRCVACYNCFRSCNLGGIDYGINPLYKTKPAHATSETRRSIITSALTLTAIATQSCSPNPDKRYKERHQLVTPPGSGNLHNFHSKCTACHLCVAACPTQVLQPTVIDYGFNGIFQPRMNYHKNYCNNDCLVCGQVCPSGAILPLRLSQKKRTQIGKVKFIKEECIVDLKKTDCGACSEHCPTKAVKMVPYSKLLIPEVNNEICIGCGACEYACPTKPHKAIYVTANRMHQIAKEPPKQKLEPTPSPSEDFPF